MTYSIKLIHLKVLKGTISIALIPSVLPTIYLSSWLGVSISIGFWVCLIAMFTYFSKSWFSKKTKISLFEDYMMVHGNKVPYDEVCSVVLNSRKVDGMDVLTIDTKRLEEFRVAPLGNAQKECEAYKSFLKHFMKVVKEKEILFREAEFKKKKRAEFIASCIVFIVYVGYLILTIYIENAPSLLLKGTLLSLIIYFSYRVVSAKALLPKEK